MNSLGLEDVELSFGVPVGSVSAAGNEARASTGNQFERGLTAIEVLADLLAVILAVSGAFFAEQLVLYRSLSISRLGTVAFVSVFVAGLVVLLLDRDGAYLAGNSLLRIKETERSLRVSVQALLLVLPAICVTGWHFSRWIFLTALLSVPLLQIIEKQLVFIGVRALRARGFGVQNVLIYGAGESGRRVFSTLIRSPKLGLNPVALVDDDPELEGQKIFESSYKREHSAKVIAGPLTRELIERLKCKLLVIAIPGLGYEKFSGAVHAAQSAETRLAFLPRHSFFSTDKIECADIDGIMLNLVLKTEKDRNYEIAKRTFDLISALVLILLLAPILAVIAILVYFDSAGKVLFTQERVGRGGELFYMYKFRSMHAEAPKYAVSPRSKVDPRITRIGRFLRRSSLDELPQLINVVKGEMSLVGPRPEMPFIACQYNPEQRQRLSVPPGITCLWQLSADRGFHIHENIEYDLYYIRHRSFFMDFAILLHTMVFAMRGV